MAIIGQFECQLCSHKSILRPNDPLPTPFTLIVLKSNRQQLAELFLLIQHAPNIKYRKLPLLLIETNEIKWKTFLASCFFTIEFYSNLSGCFDENTNLQYLFVFRFFFCKVKNLEFLFNKFNDLNQSQNNHFHRIVNKNENSQFEWMLQICVKIYRMITILFIKMFDFTAISIIEHGLVYSFKFDFMAWERKKI